jgi:hypothetical protein
LNRSGCSRESIATRMLDDGTREISWGAASDNVGVVEYGSHYDDRWIGTMPYQARRFLDGYERLPDREYAVRARDAAGNESEPAVIRPSETTAAPR